MKDYFGKDASALHQKKLFLLDMDGTIYNENRVFDGTLPFLQRVKQKGGQYIYITNNSSKSVNDYVEKLKNMNIPATAEQFFTSSQATAIYLNNEYPGKKIYCVGTRSLVSELESMGVSVTHEKNDAEVLLVGFDTELVYEKLRVASELLINGVPFVATNPDRACPVSFGFVPDCAAICEALYFATQRRPKYIGKPHPEMINYAITKAGVTKDETLLIGDRLYTDIASANNAGVDSVCVLSGEATLDELKASPDQPTFVFDDISCVMQAIDK